MPLQLLKLLQRQPFDLACAHGNPLWKSKGPGPLGVNVIKFPIQHQFSMPFWKPKGPGPLNENCITFPMKMPFWKPRGKLHQISYENAFLEA